MPQVLLADGPQGQVHLGGDAGGHQGLESGLREVQSSVHQAVAHGMADGPGREGTVAPQQLREWDPVRAGEGVGG